MGDPLPVSKILFLCSYFPSWDSALQTLSVLVYSDSELHFCISDLLATVKLSFIIHGIDILQTVYWLKDRTQLIFPPGLTYIWFRWQWDTLDNRVDVAFLVALDWGVNMILINSTLPWGSHHTEFLVPKLYHEVTLSWFLDLTPVNYSHIIS